MHAHNVVKHRWWFLKPMKDLKKKETCSLFKGPNNLSMDNNSLRFWFNALTWCFGMLMIQSYKTIFLMQKQQNWCNPIRFLTIYMQYLNDISKKFWILKRGCLQCKERARQKDHEHLSSIIFLLSIYTSTYPGIYVFIIISSSPSSHTGSIKVNWSISRLQH